MSHHGAVHTADDLSTRALLRTTLIVVGSLALAALVAFPLREPIFVAVAGGLGGSPLGPLFAAVAEHGMYLFVLAAAAGAVWTWLRDRARFWLLATGGIGVIAAYLLSELVKVIVTEERPCRTLDVQGALACPAVGDWSWPSNHSVLAAAFATALLLTFPWAARWLIAWAALLAFSRLAAGVHYLHDVLSGLALGTLVVVAVVLAMRALVLRVGARPGSGLG
ncbi:phosphatase PAP2 family protein [Pseudactinotalea sp. HY158]|uniref:phosphatase PAP2 family protein n=1 Tax=Pseudactinotalea sp. HY158 TaxID=2654547 RepID=UPI00129C94BE|nr:phosphatase PAP2 family protein [Pseudactinotalea sp. HY158]QGH70147.1 phosphatase PAP2 family protein [Pseudactinotalea sp. HY158]